MKSNAARAASGSYDQPDVTSDGDEPVARDVRIEDLGDGSAKVSLRLPWPLVLQVLDLASASVQTPRTAAA